MKYVLVLISCALALVVGVYIGELRMQVQTYEAKLPQVKTTNIIDAVYQEINSPHPKSLSGN